MYIGQDVYQIWFPVATPRRCLLCESKEGKGEKLVVLNE